MIRAQGALSGDGVVGGVAFLGTLLISSTLTWRGKVQARGAPQA